MKPVHFFPFMVPFYHPSYSLNPYSSMQLALHPHFTHFSQNEWRIEYPSADNHKVLQTDLELQNSSHCIKTEETKERKPISVTRPKISKIDKTPLKLQKENKKMKSCGSIEIT